jgi:hypothetical protein
MKPREDNPDVLGRALQKQESGRGRNATEGRALRDYAAGKIGRDHFAAIPTTPVKLPQTSLPHTPSVKGIHQVDGLEAALRTVGASADSTDLTALTARVVALETLLADYAATSLAVCIGGSATTKTFLTK